MLASISDVYQEGIVDAGKQAELILLVSFLVAFGFIRTSAHLIRRQVSWWPGNVDVGGTHIHHLVWGILLLLLAGWLMIARSPGSPWQEILAVLFGIGAGLTLDEFALWLNLDDVYWSDKGRASIDAVIVAAALGLLLLLGLRVWLDLVEGVETATRTFIAVIGALGIPLAVVNALRGRLLLALVSLFLPPIGLVGLVLPARPHSPWHRVRERVRERVG